MNEQGRKLLKSHYGSRIRVVRGAPEMGLVPFFGVSISEFYEFLLVKRGLGVSRG